ncbi:MAG: hypothetical protein IPJ68_02390 [Candidatus Moraniibacteriota bacterium]|nr:MAG: hypothetical protein IPJ68_02390 [Candidatus Moranbacteria bacterium]
MPASATQRRPIPTAASLVVNLAAQLKSEFPGLDVRIDGRKYDCQCGTKREICVKGLTENGHIHINVHAPPARRFMFIMNARHQADINTAIRGWCLEHGYDLTIA